MPFIPIYSTLIAIERYIENYKLYFLLFILRLEYRLWHRRDFLENWGSEQCMRELEFIYPRLAAYICNQIVVGTVMI